nr:MAG TPA: hypothetical protein [Caudoviricetes sp.]
MQIIFKRHHVVIIYKFSQTLSRVYFNLIEVSVTCRYIVS